MSTYLSTFFLSWKQKQSREGQSSVFSLDGLGFPTLLKFALVIMCFVLPSFVTAQVFMEGDAVMVSNTQIDISPSEILYPTLGIDYSSSAGFYICVNFSNKYQGTYPNTSTSLGSACVGGNYWEQSAYESINLETFLGTTDGDYWFFVDYGSKTSGFPGTWTELYRVYFEVNRTGGVWTFTGGAPPPDLCSDTCIYSVTPHNNAIVATSTSFAFGVTGYLSEEDFNAGNNEVRVRLDYTQSSISSWNAPVSTVACNTGIIPNPEVCGVFTWQVESAGNFDFSTTTLITASQGRYFMTTEINRTWLWILQRNLTATSTRFTIATTTGLDIFTDRIEDNFNEMVASTTLSLSSCNPLSLSGFDILACAYGLFVPPKETIKNDFQALYDNGMRVVPLGYITRFTTILLQNETVMPPSLTYRFGSSSPQFLQDITEDDPVTFQIWDEENISKLDDIRADDGSNKNIWDIVMPWFNAFIALAVLLVIIEELMGISIQFDSTQETNVSDSYDSKGVDTKTTNVHSTSNLTFTKGNVQRTFSKTNDITHVDVVAPRGNYSKTTTGSGRRGRSKNRY